MENFFTKSEKLALGTAQFGSAYGISNISGQIKSNEIFAILDLAWEKGINTLDTAKAYGKSEEIIGYYLKKHSEKKWSIITKLSESRGNISGQIQDSTEHLTIQPSIILAHSADLFLHKDFQRKLVEVKKSQKIIKVGVSLYSEDEIIQVLDSNLKPEVIQLPMNILDTRLYRHGILAQLFERNIEIHVRSVFLQGLFYLEEPDLKASFKDVIPHINKLKTIATRAGLTLGELSLMWIFSLEEISKVIIAVENVKQLKEHLETLNKIVDPSVFKEALSVKYENENFLNPSLWPSTS